MAKRIDLETWPRRATYEFFKDFDNPFFNLTVSVDIAPLYHYAKAKGYALNGLITHAILKAVDQTPALKLRIDDAGVVEFNRIHGSSVVLDESGNLRFNYYDYDPDYPTFARGMAASEVEAAQLEDIGDQAQSLNVIHFSSIPWLKFTGLSHARNWNSGDSIPKITFGRFEAEAGGKMMMPLSVEVHHALADGLQVGQFFKCFKADIAALYASLGPDRGGLHPQGSNPPALPPAEGEVGDILRFLRGAEALKDTLRSAHSSKGRIESTAEHTWRLALLALLLEDRLEGADFTRILKLTLIHDLGEAIHGDIPAIEQQPDQDKSTSERLDLLELLAPLPKRLQDKITGLWDEYDGAITPEAQWVKALDKLETLLQHTQGKNPPGFDYGFNLDYGRKYTDFNSLTRVMRALIDEETRRRMHDGD